MDNENFQTHIHIRNLFGALCCKLKYEFADKTNFIKNA